MIVVSKIKEIHTHLLETDPPTVYTPPLELNKQVRSVFKVDADTRQEKLQPLEDSFAIMAINVSLIFFPFLATFKFKRKIVVFQVVIDTRYLFVWWISD